VRALLYSPPLLLMLLPLLLVWLCIGNSMTEINYY